MGYLIIFLVNLVYLPAIKFGLVSDDATVFKLNFFPLKRSKITSIVLHIVIAEYVYYAFGQTTISLIAALLFSVHPTAIQIPVWFSGRYYGLEALKFLMIFAFAPIGVVVYFVWGVGILTNVFTPFLFLFTKHWYIVFIFIYLAWRKYKIIIKGIQSRAKSIDTTFKPGVPLQKGFFLHEFKIKNLILVVKTFGYYTLSCLLPLKNGFYNSFLCTLGASKKATDNCYSYNRQFWGGLFAMVLMFILWLFNMRNNIGIGIMLFVLSVGPYFNFISIHQFTAPRYSYLALIGFQIAFVTFIAQVFHPLVQAGIFSALFLFYLDKTIRVMQHYKKDDITMVDLDSQVFPENPRVWYFKYEHMLHKNNPVMAWAEASYGLRHLPEDCQLWFGLSCASFELGDCSAAKIFVETSEKCMILTDRQSMQSVINELKKRINDELFKKWKLGKQR